MREILRRNSRFFLITTLVGVVLRLAFILYLPSVTDDSRLYADIAKNWLQHDIYGLTESGIIVPTLTRLPGYPAFLAFVFAIFGLDNFRAVLLLQLVMDLGACLLVADITRRIVSPRAVGAAFILAAVCPFLANYVAAVLTETPEIFFTALAFDLAIIGLRASDSRQLLPWAGCGAAVGASILLRPDGGILLAAIEVYLAWRWLRSWRTGARHTTMLKNMAVLGIVALAPLAPWTARNLRTLHRFEPLAPRYATDQEEQVLRGFNRWVKTWMADNVSVEEIYWNVPGETLDPSKLPARAFDSEQQRERTVALLSDYNETLQVMPDLDRRFASLAAERIKNHRIRYYVWLPTLRIVDMWMRPRSELLPSDPRWWEFNDDPKWSALAVGFGALNLAYVAAALAGLRQHRQLPFLGLLLLYLLLRSLFLGSLENPETRYTLECYPVIITLAAVWWRPFKSGMT